MYHLVDNLQTKTGDALVGYYVKLKDSDGNYATLYADSSSTPIETVSGTANAAVTDANGQYDLYVAEGDYTIDFFDKNDINLLVQSILSVPMHTRGVAADIATAAGSDVETELSARATTADLASTASGKGAALVGSKRTSTGAVAQTLQERLNLKPLTPEDFGAVGDGATDDQAALEAMFTAAQADSLPVHFPAKTYAHSDVLETGNNIPSITGHAGYSKLKALAGFPATWDPGTGTAINTPQLYLNLDGLDRGTFRLSGLTFDGNSVAPVGYWIVSGANSAVHDIDVHDHLKASAVVDAVQNSVFSNQRLRRCAEAILIVKNYTRNCRFVANHLRKAGTYNVLVHTDANAPGAILGLGTSAADFLEFRGGVWEDVFSTSKTNIARFEAMNNSVLSGIQGVSNGASTGMTGPGFYFGSSAGSNLIDRCKINMGGADQPAIQTAGFGNRFGSDISLLNVGNGGAINAIEVSAQTVFSDMPTVSGSSYTGKTIANTSGTSSDGRVASMLLPAAYRAGSTAQRPTMTGMDCYVEYYDTTLRKLIWWDYVNTKWRTPDGAQTDAADAGAVSCANATNVTVATVSMSAGDVLEVVAFQADSSANYAHALIYADSAGKTVKTIGSNLCTISISGSNIRVNQTSGATVNYYVSLRKVR